MWSPLQSILVCKIPQFLVKSYRFRQLITRFQKADTLRLLNIYMMFCPPAGAKYPFFQAPAHGLLSTPPTPPMLHSQHTTHASTPPTHPRNHAIHTTHSSTNSTPFLKLSSQHSLNIVCFACAQFTSFIYLHDIISDICLLLFDCIFDPGWLFLD